MKRAITLIAIVVIIAACCFAGCSQLRELGSAAADKLSPALDKAEELPEALDNAEDLLSSGIAKAKDLLPDSEGEKGDESQNTSSSAEGGAWSVPSLGSIASGKRKLSSVEGVSLVSTDDYAQGYVFDYDGDQFTAYFDGTSWKVHDSYKITNHDDIVLICQALLNEHPVYGSDWESFRTADDMAYEWEQHNLAYFVLPEDSRWRDDAKDVDLDPDDQGKSIQELYESRTGQKLDISNYLPGN